MFIRDLLREVAILVSPPIDPAALVARALTLQLDDIPVRVVSIADFIELKRATGRAQDAADVVHLERLIGARDGRGTRILLLGLRRAAAYLRQRVRRSSPAMARRAA